MGNLVEAPDTLTDLDRQELSILVWYQRNHPDELTTEAWARLYELQSRPWRAFHKWEAENARRWESSLTPERVAELERKFEAGDEPVTEEDGAQWAAALYLAPAPSDDDERLDEWYQRPLSESYAESTTWRTMSTAASASASTNHAAVMATIHVQPRDRGNRPRRTGSGRGSPASSDGSGESEPPLGRICQRESCTNPLPADPRAHYCTPECGNAARQERHRRRHGAVPRVKRTETVVSWPPIYAAASPWWHDCPECDVRNYTQPPNGVACWHVPSDCTACGASLDRERVAV